MSNSHPMTKNVLLASIENFKRDVDNAWEALGNAKVSDVVAYKKVGGLHHWRIGNVGGSIYVKKAKASVTKVKPKASDVVLTATEVSETSALDQVKLGWRIKEIQDRKTHIGEPINWMDALAD